MANAPRATDWELIRSEYVNGKDSVKNLAAKFKVSENACEKRSIKDKWAEARRNMAEKVTAWADARVADVKVDELARFNADDLKMARAIRAKAAGMMATTKTPADLRALAAAVDTAQKVGRLALGASTENSTVTTKELPASVDEFV